MHPVKPRLALAAALALAAPAVEAQLDESWTVRVNGQSTPVAPDGSFRLGNVSANDAFGEGGPGTAPDGRSDDFFQLEGVSTAEGITRYVVSEPFQISRDRSYRIARLTVSESPPPRPVALRLEGAAEVAAGAVLPLSVIGVLGEGLELDLTPRLANTIYRSSNPAIATVDPDGRLTGLRSGIVFITATNSGATAVKRVDVRSTFLVTITGFVQREDGSPLAGAEVHVLGITVLTAADGSFSLTLALEPGHDVQVQIVAIVDGVTLQGASARIPVVDGREIDVGIVAALPPRSSTGFLFANPELPVGESRPTALASGDADGDGDLDLIFFDENDEPALGVLLNAGDLRFEGPIRSLIGADEDTFRGDILLLDDLDGDGDADAALLSTNRLSGLSISLNEGGGQFSSRVAFAVGNSASDFVLARLDGDAEIDVAVANSVQPGTLTLLHGTGDGAFVPGGTLTVLEQDATEHVAAGDLDGDGRDDLLATGRNLSLAALRFQDAAGGFAGPDPVNLGGWSGRPVLADFNGDGVADVAYALEFHNQLRIARNDGTGKLAPPVFFPIPEPIGITAADFDGDGDLDVAGSAENDDVLTLRNTGQGDFEVASKASGVEELTAFVAADLTGDGLPELVSSYGDGINVLINLGGTFGDEERISTGGFTSPQAHALVDLDGDGYLDIAAVVLSSPTNFLRELKNSGSGQFELDPILPAVPTAPTARKLLAANLDADDLPDLVGLDGFGTKRLFFHTNAGAAGFLPVVFQPVADNVADLALGDVDADGDLDLALGFQEGGSTSTAALSLNDGTGAYSPSGTVSVTGFLYAVQLTDIDGDGRTDVVSTSDDFSLSQTGLVVIHKNLGLAGFAGGRNVTVDRSPTAFSADDLDGDADLDLAIAHTGFPFQVTVRRNDGTASFPDVEVAETPQPYAPIARDADGDGILDLVFHSYGGRNGFTILLRNGAGFAALESFGTGSATNDLSAVDLDLDGNLDVFTSHVRGFSFHHNRKAPQALAVNISGTVLLPNGSPAPGALVRAGASAPLVVNASGAFSIVVDTVAGAELTVEAEIEVGGKLLTVTVSVRVLPDQSVVQVGELRLRPPAPDRLFPVPAFPFELESQMSRLSKADLDGDGDLDLIGSDPAGSEVKLLQNDGEGRFEPWGEAIVVFSPVVTRAADLDRDGDADVVVANRDGGTLSVLRNLGGGSLDFPVTFPLGESPSTLVLGDLDRDGDVDAVASVRSFPGPLAVVMNTGSGAFAAPVLRGPGDTGDFCVLGDLDADGDLDLAATIDGERGSLLNPGNGAFNAFVPMPFTEFGLLNELLLGDLDRDGDLDLVIGDAQGRVQLSKNNGAGTFAAPSSYVTGNSPGHMALADLDGDQDLDLVTANEINPLFVNGSPAEPDLLVHRNSGSGAFVRGEAYSLGYQRTDVLTSDVDGDGDQDLIVDAERTYVAVLINRGAALFDASPAHAAGVRPGEVAVADLNADGRLDLATANEGFCCDIVQNTLGVLLAQPGGSFAAVQGFGSGFQAVGIAAGDVDGDGDVDAALVYRGSCCEFSDGSVQVLRNNGQGTFVVDRSYDLLHEGTSIALGDLDANGRLDLACTLGQFPGGLVTLRNQGSGQFAPATPIPGQGFADDLHLGDLDGDDDLDLAAEVGDQLALFFNSGNSVFDSMRTYPVGFGAKSLTLGEFDSEPGIDLVMTVAQGFLLFHNNGEGVFIRAERHAEEDLSLGAVVAADLDLDGRLDIVSVHAYSTILPFFGDGTGGFVGGLRYLTGLQAQGVTAGDLDADGDVDVVVPNVQTGQVSIFRNATRP
jgi:hypothetical protein